MEPIRISVTHYLNPEDFFKILSPNAKIEVDGKYYKIEYWKTHKTNWIKPDYRLEVFLKGNLFMLYTFNIHSRISRLTIGNSSVLEIYCLDPPNPISLKISELCETLTKEHSFQRFWSFYECIDSKLGILEYRNQYDMAVRKLIGVDGVEDKEGYLSEKYDFTLNNSDCSKWCVKYRDNFETHLCSRTSALYLLLKAISKNRKFYSIREEEYLMTDMEYINEVCFIAIQKDSYLISNNGIECHPLSLLIFWTLTFISWRFTDYQCEDLLTRFFEDKVKEVLVRRLKQYNFLNIDFEYDSYDNLSYLMEIVNNLDMTVCPKDCKCISEYCDKDMDLEFTMLFLAKLRGKKRIKMGHCLYQVRTGPDSLEVNGVDYSYFIRGLYWNYQRMISDFLKMGKTAIKAAE